jgi:ABC-type transporter MlaC component
MNNNFLSVLGWLFISFFAIAVHADETATPGAEPTREPESAPAGPAPLEKSAAEKSHLDAEGKSFTGEALEMKNTMDGLFEASRHVNEKGPEKDKSRAKIEDALDWERVARDCVGAARYKKLSAQNKEKLRSLLHQVIVKTAFTRLDTFWTNTKYSFRKITSKNGSGVVDSKFSVGKDNFDLVYYLYKKENRWWIYDISFEDMRYSENINEQLEAFLKEKPFSALLEKLQKRLDDIQSGQVKDNVVPKPGPKKS